MGAPNWKNKTVFTGDNLHIMRGMNSASVDLIYLDPPFNSNRIYGDPIGGGAGAMFKDMWTFSDVDILEHNKLKESHKGVYAAILASYYTHSKGMFSYLTMMAVRLIEMHRLLKPTGSIYLHCDDSAGHYLKIIMDGIFGEKNFLNDITWKRTSAHSNAKRYGRIADYILYYSRSGSETWNKDVKQAYDEEYIKKYYRYQEPDGRKFKSGDLTAPIQIGGNPERRFEFKGVTRIWRYSKEKLEELDRQNLVFITRNGFPRLKQYLDETTGMALQSICMDINPVGSWHGQKEEFYTQKPIELLERIIRVSSNKGDVVFDPFCGCATTLVAAEKHSRKWVGIDLSKKSVDLVVGRIKDAQGLFKDIRSDTTVPLRTDIKQKELKAKEKRDRKHELYTLQKGMCVLCNNQFEKDNLVMDHIIPRAHGGRDFAENFQLLCSSCNSVKATRTQEDARAIIEARKRRSVDWLDFPSL